MLYYMLGKSVIMDKPYLLISVKKNGIRYCGSYSKNEDQETITSILTGEVFYNLRSFVESILGLTTTYEWCDCYYYDEYHNQWLIMLSLLPDSDLYL